MGQYENLVKALRYCAESGDFNCNKDCPMYPNYPKCLTKMDMDAAAAIEALETEIRESMQKCAECGDEQEQKVKELQARLGEAENSAERWKDMYLTKHEPKRGEWIVREVDSPGEMHPVAFRCMCSMCRNEYVFPRIPQYCPDCGSMNTAKMEVQE